jgi:hypothetical protein
MRDQSAHLYEAGFLLGAVGDTFSSSAFHVNGIGELMAAFLPSPAIML